MDSDALRADAVGDLEQGHFEQALLRFDALLELDDEDAASHLGRGQALRGLGRLADAEDALISAVEADAGLLAAWVELVDLEASAGAEDAAQENLTEALRLFPGTPALLALQTRLGTDEATLAFFAIRAALLNNQHNKTHQQNKQFLERTSEGTPLHLALQAELYLTLREGERVALIHALTRGAREHPSAWQLRDALGRVLLTEGPLQNLRQAAAYSEDAWQMSGENPWAGIGFVGALERSQKIQIGERLTERLASCDVEAVAAWARARRQGA